MRNVGASRGNGHFFQTVLFYFNLFLFSKMGFPTAEFFSLLKMVLSESFSEGVGKVLSGRGLFSDKSLLVPTQKRFVLMDATAQACILTLPVYYRMHARAP